MAMINQFRMTNVLGTLYSRGNILFTPDGFTLITPVRNKVTFHDLKNQKSRTLCFESTHDYCHLAISPNGRLLLTINAVGVAQLISLPGYTVLQSMRLGANSIESVKFSPDGKYIACGKYKKVIVYRTPSGISVGIKPFQMVRVFKDISGLVSCLDWSFDSRLLAIGSKEHSTVTIVSMVKYVNFKNCNIGGGSGGGLVDVFFDHMEYGLYAVSRGGIICKWECSLEPEGWVEDVSSNQPPKQEVDSSDEENSTGNAPAKRFRMNEDSSGPTRNELTKFRMGAKIVLADNVGTARGFLQTDGLSSVQMNMKREFCVVGFTNGSFLFVGIPTGEIIHNLKVSEQSVNALAFSPDGEWIGIATKSGELVVWEWQSESYVLKQQSHLEVIQCMDFSNDGAKIVTGGDDGKVKLWDTKSSFCFCTFSDHTATVTGVAFLQNNKAVVSSSLDGTVRAFDTTRYRNFRVFTSPRPTQFSGVCVNSSGTYVASGSIGDFLVFVWHVDSGRLLLELPGHTGPVSAIAFTPKQGSSMLATVSWDRTMRIRDSIEESESAVQVFQLEAEGVALAFRPDGKELVVATLEGTLTFFDPDEQKILGALNGRLHMANGRIGWNGPNIKNHIEDLAFHTVAYSADGSWVLAGGKSVNLCVYNAYHQTIVHKQKVTRNQSLDAQTDYHNRRLGEFGLVDLLQERNDSDRLKLPGTKLTQSSLLHKQPEHKVFGVKFSPTGTMWAAATTEGVLLYTGDSDATFAPIAADSEVTPQGVNEALQTEQYDAALFMALKLNIAATITMVLEKIPRDFHYPIVKTMPMNLIRMSLRRLSGILAETQHIDHHLAFIKKILDVHLQKLVTERDLTQPVMSALQKAVEAKTAGVAEFIQQNKYMMQVYNDMGIRMLDSRAEDWLHAHGREEMDLDSPAVKVEDAQDSDSSDDDDVPDGEEF